MSLYRTGNHVGDTENLPKWAQAMIEQLQRNVTELRAAVADGLNGTGITVERDSHSDRVKSIRVPKGKIIHGEKDWTDGLVVLFDHGTIEVRGASSLQLTPTAANVVRIGHAAR